VGAGRVPAEHDGLELRVCRTAGRRWQLVIRQLFVWLVILVRLDGFR
jgi:hypothetical protein